MMRRLFMTTIACMVTGCVSIPGAIPAKSVRVVQPLSEAWGFRYDDSWTMADARVAPESKWQEITLPHSWNRLGEYRLERTDATDNRQGRGWYRRKIDGRRLDPSKQHFLEFEAVGNVADVWLNGRHLARHAGAFTRFRVDLTPALDFGGDNTLLIKADNSNPEPGGPTADVIPLLGDFFIHGGIYRPARLISVPPSHIDLEDFGGPGVYATSVVEDDGSARIAVLVRLTKPRDGQRLNLSLRDPAGIVVAQANTAVDADSSEVRTSLVLSHPHRWNGRADPYLYRLTAALGDEDGPLDKVEQLLGIRTIRFDPDEGFFLNDRHLALHGVSRHQDRLGRGWALSEADNAQDMALIAEMGANSIRVAHYPQAPQWFDLADAYGMIAWAEVPFVNKPAFGDAPAAPELVANARTQLAEMIRQNFNHPSIVTWGIGNEVDIDLAFGRLGPKADSRPLLRELDTLAHREDPSRPTVLADCCEATPGEKVGYLPVLAGEADLMAYNRYFGWYYGEVGDLGPHLDMLHNRHPTLPISVSEYGAGGSLTQHSNQTEGRPTNPTGRPQPEEFQASWHEQTWPQIRARKYLWGSWIWNMFDFSSRIRKEGDAIDVNTKGLVSYDRKIRKDAFYYYKAHWSDAPLVHITAGRFVRRTQARTRVKVYSNAPRVEIAVGKGPAIEVPCIDQVCTLRDVTLAPGVNRIVARARFATGALTDSVEWTLSASEITSPASPASRP